ncbi:MAG TPA: copper-binding protein [Bryobacteraceae bacterium]|jgi:Cu/Ag efflux protein CusF
MSRFLARIVLVSLFLLSMVACSRMPERGAAVKKYQIHGVIVRLDPQLKTATIKHGPIVGWMEAMTMEFPVPSKDDFARLKVGDTISATVFVRDLDYYVGDVHVESK